MERRLQSVNHHSYLAEWSRRVEACRKSGQRVSEWCGKQGIPISTYYSWQRQVFQAAVSEKENGFADELTDEEAGATYENRGGILFVNSVSTGARFDETPEFVRNRVKRVADIITSAGKDRKANGGGRNWKQRRDDAVICA